MKRIKEINGLSSLLSRVLPLGMFANIFIGNKVPKTAFNIHAADWKLFSDSLSSISTIQRRLLDDETGYQILDHYSNPKQRAFWDDIRTGCAIR